VQFKRRAAFSTLKDINVKELEAFSVSHDSDKIRKNVEVVIP